MGMDPMFRHNVFQLPFALLLPWPLRRLLFGRHAGEELRYKRGNGRHSAQGASETPRPTTIPEQTQLSPNSEREFAADTPSSFPTTPCTRSKLHKKSSADNLLDVVRGMDGIARTSAEATADISGLERILTEKMMGKTATAARQLVGSAQAGAYQSYEYSKAKVSEIGDGLREVAHNPRSQVTAVSAVGGAVALGTGGGATGMLSGGAIGAACGLVPAVFTFGLSIPVCAAVGSSIGLCTGAAVAGTAGFLGGGTVGYHAYGSNEEGSKSLKES